MHSVIRHIVIRHSPLVLGLAVALPAIAADKPVRVDDAKADIKVRANIQDHLRVLAATDGATPGQRRISVRQPAEMESVTFLGVETSPVSGTLASQLGLTDGSGLVVNHVSEKSPASGVLKQHDILLKLEDQILIEQRQLAVLIRNRKDGEEVTITYLRGGKKETAKVKLAKRDMPKLSAAITPGTFFQGGPGQNFAYAFGQNGGEGGGVVTGQGLPPEVITDRDDVNRVLSLIDAARAPGQRRISISRTAEGPGSVSVSVDTGNSQISSSDDQGSLELTIKDGVKQLVAKDAKGEQIYSGPVNTPEERKALPPEVRERLEKLEDMKHFSFKSDGDFQGAETKLFRVPAQGISLPSQPAPARRPALFF